MTLALFSESPGIKRRSLSVSALRILEHLCVEEDGGAMSNLGKTNYGMQNARGDGGARTGEAILVEGTHTYTFASKR